MSDVTQPPGEHQPAVAGQPPGSPTFIINNSSSASAVAGAWGGYRRRRKQSALVHFLLFLCTAGVGNLVYAWHISSWNRRHSL